MTEVNIWHLKSFMLKFSNLTVVMELCIDNEVVNLQRNFPCPVCCTHRRGNQSGALGQAVTACCFSAYENKCQRVLNWLWCSGVSREEKRDGSPGWQADAPGLHWDAWSSPSSRLPPFNLCCPLFPLVAGGRWGRWQLEQSWGRGSQGSQPRQHVPYQCCCDERWCCPPAKLQPVFVSACRCTFLLTSAAFRFEAVCVWMFFFPVTVTIWILLNI